MDHPAHGLDQQSGTTESESRKISWSERLNKLTNNTFSRRRTSNTNASSESLTLLPQRSYIPTPSSRNSSCLGGLGLDFKDIPNLSGTQKPKWKGSSMASTRRHTQQASASTSSFFDGNGLGPLYPREFLDESDTGGNRKENKRLTEETCWSQESEAQRPQPSLSPNLGAHLEFASNTKESTKSAAKQTRESEISTESNIQDSRRICDRLVQNSLFKQQPARHSIAAVPLSSPTKPQDGESSVKIEERRLMAPINPPLPRSATMVPLNGSSAHARQYSSPRTPSFMRPTSSSAARRSTICNAYKTPPTPLTSASGQRSADIPGFFIHRERKRAAHDAAMTLGSRSVSHECTPGFLPGNGPQIMARNGLCAVQERAMTFGVPEDWAMKNLPSPPSRIPDPTTSAEADFNSSAPRNMAMSPQRYPFGPRYGPRTELHAAYTSPSHEVQLPVPPLPQQPIVDRTSTGYESQSRGPPRPVTQSSRIPRSISNAADLPFDRGTNRSLGIQASTSEYHLPTNRDEVLPLPVRKDSYSEYRAAHVSFPPRKASLAAATGNPKSIASGSAGAPSSTPARVVAFATTVDSRIGDESDEVDLTLIRGAQDLRFRAGRYTAVSDCVRNDASISAEAARYAHSDEQRQRIVLQYLSEKCADEETRESLNAFVRAWAHGWTGGVAGAFLGVAPQPVVSARTSGTEERKKGGLMGKMFGRRKSQPL
ncbi:MAG: hypothetical protein Q9169_006213 [Polycauliona sp. 2 TL-2023]